MDPYTSDSEHRSHSELEAAIKSLNHAPSNESDVSHHVAGTALNVISKIEWLETELVQQKRNFENVDRRFDDLSSQIAALCNAITSATDVSPAGTDESATAEQYEATDMDCAHSPEFVPEETETVPHKHITKLCESIELPKTQSNDDVSGLLLEVRTRGAVSLDNLLAKLSAVDSGPDCGADEVPQPDASPELESILPETTTTDDAIDQQQRKLEELFASLRNRDGAGDAENALTSTEAVETLSENRSESEQPEEVQYSSAGSDSTEFEQQPETHLSTGRRTLPELDDTATFNPEIQLPELNVALEESTAAGVAVTLPEAVVTKPAASRLAEHIDGADVQDYMNSLLQRLKGGEPSKQPIATTFVHAVPPARTLTEAPVNSDLQPVTERLKPNEFLPKRVAPEKNANMTAMRELANASSRSAVKSSELRRQKANSNLQLLLTGGGIAGAAFTSALSQSRGDLFFYLSICLLVISLACIYFYARVHIFGQNTETDGCDAEPKTGETAGFDWSKLNEFTTVILSKLNRSPKESN